MNTSALARLARPTAAAVTVAVGLSLPVSAAQAASPYNIKTTVQYQNMRDYVDVLAVKKATPATSAQVQKYTIKLDTHTDRTRNKARTLFQQELFNAKTARSADKTHIKALSKAQTRAVNTLKQSRRNHVVALRADEKQTDVLIVARYSKQSAPVQKALTKSRKQLKKTTDPLTRAQLKLDIDNYSNELADFNQSQEKSLALSDAHYDQLVASTKRTYRVKIDQTKSTYNSEIATATTQMQDDYASSVDAARSRRADNFAAVKTLHHTGASYIATMPVTG